MPCGFCSLTWCDAGAARRWCDRPAHPRTRSELIPLPLGPPDGAFDPADAGLGSSDELGGGEGAVLVEATDDGLAASAELSDLGVLGAARGLQARHARQQRSEARAQRRVRHRRVGYHGR